MALPLQLDTAEYQVMVDPLASRASLSGKPDPPSTSVRVRFGAVSHPGRVRSRNEDHYMVSKVRRTLNVLAHNLPKEEMPSFVGEDAYAMVVADGMGGMNAGD